MHFSPLISSFRSFFYFVIAKLVVVFFSLWFYLNEIKWPCAFYSLIHWSQLKLCQKSSRFKEEFFSFFLWIKIKYNSRLSNMTSSLTKKKYFLPYARRNRKIGNKAEIFSPPKVPCHPMPLINNENFAC